MDKRTPTNRKTDGTGRRSGKTPPTPANEIDEVHDDRRTADEDERIASPAGAVAASASGEPEKKRKSLFRRPLFWFFVVVAIGAIVAAGLYYWLAVRPFETTDDAFIGADVVDISPQTSGRVASVAVRNNAHVEAGALLVRIDPASANAGLARAEAQLAQAQAELRQAQVGVEQARNQEAEAEAKSAALTVTAENDRDTLSRDEQLLKSASSAITQKQVDNDRAEARAAEAQAEAGRRSIATAKSGIQAAEAKVTSAKASVQAAEAQVQTAQITLGYTTITAPLSGQIVQKNVNVGSYVTPGQPMMALVPDELYVTANFKETQLSDIRIGQPVDIHVDAYPDVRFHGKVVSIQHGAGQAFQLLPPQNATGNFVKVVQRVPVRISITTKDLSKYPLGPGMSVVPKIRVD